jgi:hypothetical protein
VLSGVCPGVLNAFSFATPTSTTSLSRTGVKAKETRFCSGRYKVTSPACSVSLRERER